MLSFFSAYSIIILILIVLCLNAVFMNYMVNIPPKFNKFTSWILSPVTTVFVVEDVSRKEQNSDEELRPIQEVKSMEKALFFLSLMNLIIYTIFTLVIPYQNYKIQILLHNMFLYVFLPLAGLNVLSCLLMFYLPASSSKGGVRSLNTVLNVLIFTATIISPLASLTVVGK